jgi:hypothetical protein
VQSRRSRIEGLAQPVFCADPGRAPHAGFIDRVLIRPSMTSITAPPAAYWVNVIAPRLRTSPPHSALGVYFLYVKEFVKVYIPTNRALAVGFIWQF